MYNLNIFFLRHKKVILITKNWNAYQNARKKSIKSLNDRKTHSLVIVTQTHELKRLFDFELLFFDYCLNKKSPINTQKSWKNSSKDNWKYFLSC